MIAVRLGDDDERRFEELARKAGTTSGPFARRVLMAFIEGRGDAAVLAQLAKVERIALRVERKVDAFLENAEIADPDDS